MRERLYVWRVNVCAHSVHLPAKYMLAMMDPMNGQTYSRIIPDAEAS